MNDPLPPEPPHVPGPPRDPVDPSTAPHDPSAQPVPPPLLPGESFSQSHEGQPDASPSDPVAAADSAPPGAPEIPTVPIPPAATAATLGEQLRPVLDRHRRLGFWQRLALGLGGAVVVALLVAFLTWAFGFSSPLVAPLLAVAGLVGAAIFAFAGSSRNVDAREAAREVENLHPELRGLLLTAVQQQPDAEGRLGYLQERVIREALAHGESHDWTHVVPAHRLRNMRLASALAAVLFGVLVWNLRVSAPPGQGTLIVRTDGITVTPGDVTLERGSSLVVLARFAGTIPASAELVLTGESNTVRRLPLTRSLSDPVFAISLPEVPSDLSYRVEYAGQKSRDFKVTVYDHPKLERSDAELTFPSYTGETTKRIENTRRVSAVEGTRLDLALQLNKSVKTARLVPRDTSLGLPAVDLLTPAKAPAATLTNWVPSLSATYDLQLVDADGRSNKEPAQFVFQVLTNRTPELKLTSPRGDIRPSALEEIAFEGSVWDDFGTVAYGLAYTHGGGETQFLELGRDVPGKEKKSFRNLLRLEELGARPDQLLSWYLWADDIGPDGKIRRTSTDMYFAEIRPFEEVFRESPNDSPQQQQEGEGQGSPTSRLAELQKQIVNATWKLERERRRTPAPQLATDTTVVRDSQAQALEKAESTRDEDNDPRTAPLWKTVVDSMKEAREKLDTAIKSPDSLAPAIKSEQTAYQALLRLREREIQIARSRNRQQRGSGAGEEMRDRQMDQLEFADAENRYETQNQAQAPTDPARSEQLQVLNRLQELSRRQQDVNERLKELQTALREADTEQEKEEIRRRLKRLQEEQQQMLADMDELQQRMNSPENQSRMAEQRKQLEQARNDMQRATDATGQGSVPQALAAGTRAERQLEDVRDQVRKQNSSEFAEDLRQMRAEARELARRQEELNKDLAGQEKPTTRQPTLAPSEPKTDLAERIQSQKERLTNLVNRATQVAEASETSEPIVSRRLEETVRRLNQDESASVSQLQNELIERGLMSNALLNRLKNSVGQDPAKSLEATAEMLRQGLTPEAERAGRRTQSNLDNLQAGVSRAAETVLGDDLEALRQARARLDQLANQLEREMAQANPQSTNTSGGASATGSTNRNQRPMQLAQNNRNTQSQTNRQGSRQGNPGERQGNQQSGNGEQTGEPQDGGQQPGGQQPGGQQPGGQQPGGQQPGGQQPGGQQPGGQQPGGQQPGGQQPGGQQPGGQQPGGQQPGGQQPGGQQPGGQQPGGQQPGGQQPGGQQPGGQQPGGQQPGGQQPGGQQPGGQQPGGQQPGGQQPGGQQPGGRQPGRQGQPGQPQGPRGQQAGANRGLNRDANRDLGEFLGRGGPEGGGGDNPGPITGVDFAPWSDGLREVEEMVDLPELRNDVATARERARNLRLEWRKAGQKPDWAVVRGQVLGPLVEVRDRIAEEIARRDRGEQLVPIDRDPVPTRYSELVRRYYEELGKDR